MIYSVYLSIYLSIGFPGGTSVIEPTCQCTRHTKHWFDPWIMKLPWRRKWQPTPVFLPGEFYGQRSLVGRGLQSMGSERAGHDWTTKHTGETVVSSGCTSKRLDVGRAYVWIYKPHGQTMSLGSSRPRMWERGPRFYEFTIVVRHHHRAPLTPLPPSQARRLPS